MKEINVKLIGKTKEDILEILEGAVAQVIRQDSKICDDGTSGYCTDKDDEVTFSWTIDEAEYADVYGNPLDEKLV